MVLTAALALAALAGGFAQLAAGLRMQREARVAAQQEVQRANAVLEHLLNSIEALDPAGEIHPLPTLRVLDSAAASLGDAFAGQPDVQASAHCTLGRLYLALGRLEPSEHHLRRALSLRQAIFGELAPDTIESLRYLAALLLERDQVAEAEMLLEHAVLDGTQALGPHDPEVARATFDLGRLRERQERFAEAAALCRAAVQALHEGTTAARPDHWLLAVYRRDLGRCLMRAHQYRDAEAELLTSLGAFKTLLGEDHLQSRRTAELLHELYQQWEQPHDSGPQRPS
jgi:tetratricopeptide (TPR) repeat protein